MADAGFGGASIDHKGCVLQRMQTLNWDTGGLTWCSCNPMSEVLLVLEDSLTTSWWETPRGIVPTNTGHTFHSPVMDSYFYLSSIHPWIFLTCCNTSTWGRCVLLHRLSCPYSCHLQHPTSVRDRANAAAKPQDKLPKTSANQTSPALQNGIILHLHPLDSVGPLSSGSAPRTLLRPEHGPGPHQGFPLVWPLFRRRLVQVIMGFFLRRTRCVRLYTHTYTQLLVAGSLKYTHSWFASTFII